MLGGGKYVWLIALCALLTTYSYAQHVRYEVKWEHSAPNVNLDSLGRDYQFSGADRTPHGLIVHRGVYAWGSATTEVSIEQVEYIKLPFSVTNSPTWLKEELAPEAEIVNARGDLVLRTLIPALGRQL